VKFKNNEKDDAIDNVLKQLDCKKKTFKRKKDLTPNADDLIPIYKEKKMKDSAQNDKYIKMYHKTMSNFPFEADEVYL
jgi:hypothetical protein